MEKDGFFNFPIEEDLSPYLTILFIVIGGRKSDLTPRKGLPPWNDETGRSNVILIQCNKVTYKIQDQD